MKPSRNRQHGLTLVELMVGLAIGLTIVAAGLLAMTHHLRHSQSLLIQARLQQDLRTASELIARGLRRTGPLSLADGSARFTDPDTQEALAYRLRNGVIEMQIGAGAWQAMTDANTLRVATFRLVPSTEETLLDGFCSHPCTEGNSMCPPRQLLRTLEIDIEAQPAHLDLPRQRTTTTVRLRHDPVVGTCAA